MSTKHGNIIRKLPGSHTIEFDNVSSIAMLSEDGTNSQRLFQRQLSTKRSTAEGQHQQTPSSMLISVDRQSTMVRPGDRLKSGNSRASTRVFHQALAQQRHGTTQHQTVVYSNVNGQAPAEDEFNEAVTIPIQFKRRNNQSSVISIGTSSMGSAMTLPMPSSNNNNFSSKRLIQLDVQKTNDGAYRAIARDDAASVLSRQQRSAGKPFSNNGANVAEMATAATKNKSNTVEANSSRLANDQARRQQSSTRRASHKEGHTTGRQRQQQQQAIVDSNPPFVRVATQAPDDGLAHFEKNDYEKFVEDRQRAILLGTLPNSLEEALLSPTFHTFINKLRDFEQWQNSHSHNGHANSKDSATNKDNHTRSMSVLQQRLEAIEDDEADYVVNLDSDQPPTGRQAGGYNQQQMLSKRLSRPQTRTGGTHQHQKSASPTKSQQLLTKGISHSQTPQQGNTSSTLGQITGHSMLQQRSGVNTTGRNSTLPQGHQQASSNLAAANKNAMYFTGHSQQGHNNATVVAPSGSGLAMFPFPPPSNVLYNMSRPAPSSKTSLPVVGDTTGADKNVTVTPSRIKLATTNLGRHVQHQQLKVVNVNFQQLKIDNASYTSSNH